MGSMLSRLFCFVLFLPSTCRNEYLTAKFSKKVHSCGKCVMLLKKEVPYFEKHCSREVVLTL